MDNKKTIVKVDDNDMKTKTHTIWVYKTIDVDQSGQYFLLAKVKPQRFWCIHASELQQVYSGLRDSLKGFSKIISHIK